MATHQGCQILHPADCSEDRFGLKPDAPRDFRDAAHDLDGAAVPRSSAPPKGNVSRRLRRTAQPFASKNEIVCGWIRSTGMEPLRRGKVAAKFLRLERQIRSPVSEGPENSSGHEGRMQCCRSIQFALGFPCRCEAGMDMVSVWAFRGSIPSIDNRD